MTQKLSIVTGCSAGATESFVVVPFELVKIKYVAPFHFTLKLINCQMPQVTRQNPSEYLQWSSRRRSADCPQGWRLGAVCWHGGDVLAVRKPVMALFQCTAQCRIALCQALLVEWRLLRIHFPGQVDASKS